MPEATREIDTNVRIPNAVKAAAERAAAVHKSTYETPDDKPPETPDDKPPETPTQSKPPETPTQSKPPETPTQSEQPNDPPVTTEGNWENRYKAMKGRFDSASARITEQNRALENLQGQVTALKEQVEQAKATPAPAPGEAAPGTITQEEEEAYGTEFLDVVARRAKQELTPLEQRLMGQIGELRDKVASFESGSKDTARSQLINHLNSSIPDWEATNTNAEFLKWLQLPDPYSGGIRQNLLSAAFERNDGPRVAAFFRGFLAEEAAVEPAPSAVDPTPDVKSASGKVSLDRLAAPGRARSAAAPGAPAEKPEFTRASIAKFYADVAAGRYEGKDDERASTEREIFAAQAEGRIR